MLNCCNLKLWLAVLVTCVICVLPSSVSAGSDDDVRAVIDKWVSIFNNPKLEGDRKERVRQLSALYAKQAKSSKKLMYFGVIQPVAKDSKSQVNEIDTAFEWHTVQGVKYSPELAEVDIQVVGDLAIVAATVNNKVVYPDGEVEVVLGRWTAAIRRYDKNWLIIHEHRSFYSAADSKRLKELETEVDVFSAEK